MNLRACSASNSICVRICLVQLHVGLQLHGIEIKAFVLHGIYRLKRGRAKTRAIRKDVRVFSDFIRIDRVVSTFVLSHGSKIKHSFLRIPILICEVVVVAPSDLMRARRQLVCSIDNSATGNSVRWTNAIRQNAIASLSPL